MDLILDLDFFKNLPMSWLPKWDVIKASGDLGMLEIPNLSP